LIVGFCFPRFSEFHEQTGPVMVADEIHNPARGDPGVSIEGGDSLEQIGVGLKQVALEKVRG
jgi:hypothetical protein